MPLSQTSVIIVINKYSMSFCLELCLCVLYVKNSTRGMSNTEMDVGRNRESRAQGGRRVLEERKKNKGEEKGHSSVLRSRAK